MEKHVFSLARLSVLCAIAACIASGLGSARIVTRFVALWAANCSSHGGATVFVVGGGGLPWAVEGIAAGVILVISWLVIERTVKSQSRRLHLTHWLALLGLLLALAPWFSTLSVSGLPWSCA